MFEFSSILRSATSLALAFSLGVPAIALFPVDTTPASNDRALLRAMGRPAALGHGRRIVE